MANINDLVQTNREITSASAAALKELAGKVEVIAPAMKSARAALDLDPGISRRMAELSGLIRKEMEMFRSIQADWVAQLDLVKPIAFASSALAEVMEARMAALAPLRDLARPVPSSVFKGLEKLAIPKEVLSPPWSAVSKAELAALRGPSLSSAVKEAAKLFSDAHVLSGRLYGLTALSESVLSSIRPKTLGIKLGIDAAVRESLAAGLGSFTDRYRGLLAEVAKPDSVVLPARYVHLPAVEHLNQAELSAASSEVEPSAGLDEACQAVDTEVLSETEDDLTRLVSEFDPALLKPIWGAREALEKRGTDYERHAATSLREAFTHALHRLAPDDRVRAWATSKADFDDKNRPTRAARLRYICREVSDTFGGFLTTDVELAVKFINEFHRATHGIAIQIAHEELVKMRARMEGLLRLMLLAGLGRLR